MKLNNPKSISTTTQKKNTQQRTHNNNNNSNINIVNKNKNISNKKKASPPQFSFAATKFSENMRKKSFKLKRIQN